MLIRQTLSSVASLLLSYGLLLVANGLLGTLFGLRTKLEGFPTLVVGLIVSAYFVGMFAGGIWAVYVIARGGHIRAFAAFASLMSVTAIGIVLVIDPWIWTVLRFIGGFCMAGMIMVTESWLNERTVNASRGQVLSFYMITNYLGVTLGQFILPLGDPAHFELFCVASIIYSLALLPVLLTQADAPTPTPRERPSIPELWRVSPLALLGVMAAGAVNAGFHGLGPVFAHDTNLSVTQTAIFMAAGVSGGLLLQWPVGRMSDRMDRRSLLIAVVLASTAISLGVAFTSAIGNFVSMIALTVVYGGLSFAIYSICLAHANDFVPAKKLVRVSSGMLMAYGIGASFGPLLSSTLMSGFGAQMLFVVSAGVHGALGLFALYRMRRRSVPSRM
ncbi:MFS transporter [Thioalkalivibrio sp. HK1]|uniref:MFS transporter n=1 Tax=Thioalkalivibrio sp. HK1 TaxID=1469245 RepID=UPI0004B0F718|nr:MFS transporter [Thioalkalivibrio sp. HK1]